MIEKFQKIKSEPLLPLISITVPAYKHSFLKECINSVLLQTYPHFELIIVNDASPFDLDSIVLPFKDNRIRYYKNNQNCGAVKVVDNWNKCLDYAKGDYIICMGDDDKLMPHCLEEYVKLLRKYPGLGVYHAWSEIIDENSNFKQITAARIEFESAYSLLWHRWNGRRQQYIGDFLFDTNLLRQNGGFYYLPLAWSSDEITATIAAKFAGIANTQVPCFYYRINSQTISKSVDTEHKLEAICGAAKWCEDFLEKEPENEIDKLYWICLKNQRNKYFDRQKALEVAHDLHAHSFIRLFKWSKGKKKYGLSRNVILFAIYEAIKFKFMKS